MSPNQPELLTPYRECAKPKF